MTYQFKANHQVWNPKTEIEGLPAGNSALVYHSGASTPSDTPKPLLQKGLEIVPSSP